MRIIFAPYSIMNGGQRYKKKPNYTNFRVKKRMKAKVIIVNGNKETEEVLNRLVHRISTETSIKTYPNVDFGAVFFPVDQHDLSYLKRILKDKGFYFKVEDAE